MTGLAITPRRLQLRSMAAIPMIVMLLVLIGCDHGDASKAGAPLKLPPVPVTVATVTQQDMPEQILGIGNVEAMSTVMLRPQVDAQMTAVHFAEGQQVHAGDLLFELDRRPFEAALAAAEAQLAKNTAMADDADRAAQQMSEAGASVSQRELDRARADAQAARAQITADKSAIELARLQLEYCSIRSPLNGRAGAILVKPGNIVRENETDLVQINQISPILVAFAIPEHHLARVQQQHGQHRNLAIDASIPGDQAEPVRGTLVFIDNKVDPSTGTIRLKGRFTNDDFRLWPGQFVNVVFVVNMQPDAIVAPSAAIQSGQMGRYAFVVRPDHTVEQRAVNVGPVVNSMVIINDGLAPGETVVTDGHLRLAPGSAVEILSPKIPAGGAS